MKSSSLSPEQMKSLVAFYKKDSQGMIDQMIGALSKWSQPDLKETARKDLRRIAHRLRGSGRTYGFRVVTHIGKALERMMEKLESGVIVDDQRTQTSIEKKVNRLAEIFKGDR